MLKDFLHMTTGIAFSSLLACSASAQANQTLNAAGAPPKILNIVRQEFIPGKEALYTELLSTIARDYDRARIPVYWIGARSFTGPSGGLFLNFFDSFAEAEAAGDTLSKTLAAHPELPPMQERLVSFISSATNTIAVRRDGISYRADAVDFSKARVLRVATVLVRQGREEEFEEAIKALRDAYGRINANAPWVTYQVNAGAPSTTFVIFMPMHSMKNMDDYIARSKALRDAEGSTVVSRLQEIARNAYISWDSELYVVHASISHVSGDFAAGDSGFWKSAQ